MDDSGNILTAVNYVNHLRHNLGCLEDLITYQPECRPDSATIVCRAYLTPTKRIIQIAHQELPPDFTAVLSSELICQVN